REPVLNHAATNEDLAAAMGSSRMQPLGATLDVVGVDEEVVEHHEPLQRVRSGERRGQHTESTQADLHWPIERRDDVGGRLGRHLTHCTLPSFASWWQMPPRSRLW